MSLEFMSTYSGLPILVTGHSGFKGGWLTIWLEKIGANVTGLSLPPDQGPDNLFEKAGVGDSGENLWIDIRNAENVAAAIQKHRPRIIFHLAAQPLVQRSYKEPLLTFETNVIGAANVLEAARHCDSVEAVVFVTSDKVYDNKEWVWAYRENDRLGGLDPYSASKGAAELLARSYMEVLNGPASNYRLATARGGNVVGGGDWSENRIVPDIVRAIRAGDPLVLRHPEATRPWQHVLELCAGYLKLGSCLLNGLSSADKNPEDFIGAWNFGPDRANEMSVASLVEVALKSWGNEAHPVERGILEQYESTYLRVDSSKSQVALDWTPLLDFSDTIDWTIDWYRQYVDDNSSARKMIDKQIDEYMNLLGGE
jgi:CDP-glucose 4,6-dehydratase